ncbi:MAG: DUF2637 domain-containing protein [Hamadaea sp.]|nr:DUF2637 domain-containing protein [Hamadaea sp.]
MTDTSPQPHQRPPTRPPTSAMTTLASRASATLVALIAGYSSYTHIAHVALRHGERPDVAYLLPFAIDGLLIVATTAMLDDKRHHRHIRTSARLAFTFGVTASLAANIASAQPTTTARIVAAIPAITLLLAIEVISRTGRPQPANTTATPDTTAATPGHPNAATTSAGPVTSTADTAADPGQRNTRPDGRARHDRAASGPADRRDGRRRHRTGTVDESKMGRTDRAALEAAARAVHAAMADEGIPVTRDGLAARLRDAGHTVSNSRASDLVRLLRANTSEVHGSTPTAADEGAYAHDRTDATERGGTHFRASGGLR